MCLAHNILLLNLNSICLQCEQVTEPKDIADFIIYCQCSIEEIHTHHEMEEANLFPQIAEYSGEKDIMVGNLAQHHAFQTSLERLEGHLATVTPETYDGKRLKNLIETFAKDLVPHLSDEIQTLLGLEKYGGEELGNLFKEFNAKILPSIKDKVRLPLAHSILSTSGLAECELTAFCSTVCSHAFLAV
jgi:hemerythrin-like domain-containing protein